MTVSRAVPPLHLDPPGPGFWELDPVHFPRPATRYWVEVHPEPFKRGTSEFARGYGMLIDGLEMAYVQGFAYKTVRPAPESEIPKRFARAAEVLDTMKRGLTAEMAGRYSGEPGAKERGGALGVFPKDRMLPAFSNAAITSADCVTQPNTCSKFHSVD